MFHQSSFMESMGWSPKLQWLERKGTDLLNRPMLVRIQSGAPLINAGMAYWGACLASNQEV